MFVNRQTPRIFYYIVHSAEYYMKLKRECIHIRASKTETNNFLVNISSKRSLKKSKDTTLLREAHTLLFKKNPSPR